VLNPLRRHPTLETSRIQGRSKTHVQPVMRPTDHIRRFVVNHNPGGSVPPYWLVFGSKCQQNTRQQVRATQTEHASKKGQIKKRASHLYLRRISSNTDGKMCCANKLMFAESFNLDGYWSPARLGSQTNNRNLPLAKTGVQWTWKTSLPPGFLAVSGALKLIPFRAEPLLIHFILPMAAICISSLRASVLGNRELHGSMLTWLYQEFADVMRRICLAHSTLRGFNFSGNMSCDRLASHCHGSSSCSSKQRLVNMRRMLRLLITVPVSGLRQADGNLALTLRGVGAAILRLRSMATRAISSFWCSV
jgi:hypothetical protein